ncbi:ATP synthase subunit e, mitochondrial-like [Ceratina calcarata]|uniref:ATP synthase F(0) complex subunit e, mitochondrial n=1 Tax=Ceratina calcarata TaxID=156304 RepID=A0AAJ7IYD7_9HYME|nr:ATP synthase subunit e, mitochondrial-like [Ceratina calcarata]XP_017889386.1 ATP synthase subunit e, mitochondrial-like [Ceratina calcarata]
MSSVEAGPRPLQVSPVIKFARWSFLLTGILYGAYHQRRLSKRENARREQELREKPMRDAKLAEERKRLLEAETKMLNETLQIK